MKSAQPIGSQIKKDMTFPIGEANTERIMDSMKGIL